MEQDSQPRASEYLRVLIRNVFEEINVEKIALNITGLANSEQENSDLRLQVVLYEFRRDKPDNFNKLCHKFDL